jgi:hypothetical protein
MITALQAEADTQRHPTTQPKPASAATRIE